MSTGVQTQARIAARIAELTAARIPFVRATVVRAQLPTSTQPGDTAIVLGDGSMDGFVGGQCAETSVRAAATDVLNSGAALLLRILPGGDDEFPETPGARTVVNPCLSGGAVEVFLEPLLPAPLVSIVGTSPIAEALASMCKSISYEVDRATSVSVAPGTTAVIIASHGHDEEGWIRAALAAGVGFIGLVASPKRGAAVVDGLDLTEAERHRVHTPLGLWIGAKTADEIAVSIVAELVQAIRLGGVRPAPVTDVETAVTFGRSEVHELETAIDPVCGMTVVVASGAITATVDGEQFWFCCTGCRDRYTS